MDADTRFKGETVRFKVNGDRVSCSFPKPAKGWVEPARRTASPRRGERGSCRRQFGTNVGANGYRIATARNDQRW